MGVGRAGSGGGVFWGAAGLGAGSGNIPGWTSGVEPPSFARRRSWSLDKSTAFASAWLGAQGPRGAVVMSWNSELRASPLTEGSQHYCPACTGIELLL